MAVQYGDTPGSLTGKQSGSSQHLVGINDDDNTIYGDAGIAITDTARGGDDFLVGGDTHGNVNLNTNILVGDAQYLSGKAIGGSDILTGGNNVSHTELTTLNNYLYGDASSEMSGYARGGNDTLTGGSNTSTIGTTNNVLYADASTMSGKAIGGADTLIGGDNSTGGSVFNVLFGDAEYMSDTAKGGNDVLIAGTAAPGSFVNNVMYGDARVMTGLAKGGADTFVFHDHDGMTVGANNFIQDFSQTQHDKIEFWSVPGVTNITALIFDTASDPGSTVIHAGTDTVTLVGFTGTLTAHDFVFV